jgi:hypothetical protein
VILAHLNGAPMRGDEIPRLQTRSPALRTPGFRESLSAAWLAGGGGVSRAISNKQVQTDWFPDALEEVKKKVQDPDLYGRGWSGCVVGRPATLVGYYQAIDNAMNVDQAVAYLG